MSESHDAAAKLEYATAQIAVWWDMNDCPIPEGYDARWVRQSIEGELRKLGYFGPVSITAYGDQKQTPDHLLRGLSSTGVSVAHAIYENTCSVMFADILKWRGHNPPPATMMLVSDHVEPLLNCHLDHVPKYDIYMGWDLARLQQETKYNLFLAYSFTSQLMSVLDTSAEWLWKKLLDNKPEEIICTELPAMFYCKSCSFDCQSLPSFTKHLSSRKHLLEELDKPGNGQLDPVTRTWSKNYSAKPEYATAQIAVWWDMNDCPIPEGYDARWVRPSIEGAFKKLGYSGPVSISAYGHHKQTPEHLHLLQGLSSTGVTVVHTLVGRTSSLMFHHLSDWQHLNPPPATMMLISNEVSLERRLSTPLAWLQQMTKYNLFLAYPYRPYKMSVLVTSAEWLWDTLLAETRRPLLQLSTVSETRSQQFSERTHNLQWCSERGESTGMFYCGLCYNDCGYKSLDDFRKHLSTKEHTLRVYSIYDTIRFNEHERRLTLGASIQKSKRLRKAFPTGFRLLHNHLRLTTRGDQHFK